VTGRVVTFYSYKGGVGRSFALANVAVILAEFGFKVLAIDWDIEAPGLEHYFDGRAARAKAGVVDFLKDCAEGRKRSWQAYAAPVELGRKKGELWLMPAQGSGGFNYAEVVQDLDWDALYAEHGLGARIEEIRARWVDRFDFVLIDSRTGVTDFSGLTTAQLPDVLAFMFTANEQSLGGCIDVAGRALEARRNLPVDRPAILPLPIPARFDQREEYERAQHWRNEFAHRLAPFFGSWLPRGTDLLRLIDLITLPYVPRWTFGEELAALLEPPGSGGVRSPGHLASYACETLAALLANNFARIDLLTTSRDEYVHAARKLGSPDTGEGKRKLLVYVSEDWSSSFSEGGYSVLRGFLDKTGLEYELPQAQEGNRRRDGRSLMELLETADLYFVYVSPQFAESSIQTAEAKQILLQMSRGRDGKMVFPIVYPGAEEAFYRSPLASFQPITLDERGIPVPHEIESAVRRVKAQIAARQAQPPSA
jgi:hypothetical protein